jgi:hypothetical protein
MTIGAGAGAYKGQSPVPQLVIANAATVS